MRLLFTFILGIWVSVGAYAQNLDIDLLKSINVGRNQSLDPAFRFITHTASPIDLGMPIIIYSVGYFKKDQSLKQKGIYLAETALMATVISTSLKYSIDRERPFNTYPFIEKATSGGSPSFPSGHTSAAFSSATSLSIAFPKWYIIAPSFLWASAMGYSRMHLGVHYPSDVLAGAIIGSGSAFLTYKLNQWIQNRKAKPTL